MKPKDKKEKGKRNKKISLLGNGSRLSGYREVCAIHSVEGLCDVVCGTTALVWPCCGVEVVGWYGMVGI